MKRNMLKITAMICLAIMTSQCELPASNTIEGNGNVVTRAYDITAFDEVSVALPATVNYTVSNTYSCRVRVDENLFDYLDIRVKDKELLMGTVKTKDGDAKVKAGNGTINVNISVNLRPTEFVIEISAPSLEEVNLASSGEFVFLTQYDAKSLEINVAGSGDIVFKEKTHISDFEINVAGSGNVECNQITSEKMDVNIAGLGDVDIKSGNISKMEASVAGSGSMTSHAELEKLEASIAGSGDITAKVNGTLEYSIIGSGSINYYGNARVDGTKLGSGSVKRIKEK